jgi:hypothetical protein
MTGMKCGVWLRWSRDDGTIRGRFYGSSGQSSHPDEQRIEGRGRLWI